MTLAAAPLLTADGLLRRPLTWFVDPYDAALEIACARIIARCPHCWGESVHGWKLTSITHPETRLCHHCGETYDLRPAFDGTHEIDPHERVDRPARRRAEG